MEGVRAWFVDVSAGFGEVVEGYLKGCEEGVDVFLSFLGGR